jgi:hypothetical protein
MIFRTKFLILFPHLLGVPHIHNIISYLKKMEMHSVNMFSHGCIFIIIAVLCSTQKWRLYVDSWIAAHKQKRCKSKEKYAHGVYSQVSLSMYTKFWIYVFLGSWIKVLTHKPTHILFYSYDSCLTPVLSLILSLSSKSVSCSLGLPTSSSSGSFSIRAVSYLQLPYMKLLWSLPKQKLSQHLQLLVMWLA